MGESSSELVQGNSSTKQSKPFQKKVHFFSSSSQAWLLVTSSISPYSCLDNNMKMVYCCLFPVFFLFFISQSSFQLQYSLEISLININKLSFQNESKSVRYCHLAERP